MDLEETGTIESVLPEKPANPVVRASADVFPTEIETFASTEDLDETAIETMPVTRSRAPSGELEDEAVTWIGGERSVSSYRPRRLVAVVGIAALFVGAIILVTLLPRPPSSEGEREAPSGHPPQPLSIPSATTETAPPLGDHPEPAGEELPAQVRITLERLPEDAQVTVDGDPIVGSVIEAPQSDREVLVVVRAEGFQTWERRLPTSSDATIQVQLERNEEREPLNAKRATGVDRPRTHVKIRRPSPGKAPSKRTFGPVTSYGETP